MVSSLLHLLVVGALFHPLQVPPPLFGVRGHGDGDGASVRAVTELALDSKSLEPLPPNAADQGPGVSFADLQSEAAAAATGRVSPEVVEPGSRSDRAEAETAVAPSAKTVHWGDRQTGEEYSAAGLTMERPFYPKEQSADLSGTMAPYERPLVHDKAGGDRAFLSSKTKMFIAHLQKEDKNTAKMYKETRKEGDAAPVVSYCTIGERRGLVPEDELGRAGRYPYKRWSGGDWAEVGWITFRDGDPPATADIDNIHYELAVDDLGGLRWTGRPIEAAASTEPSYFIDWTLHGDAHDNPKLQLTIQDAEGTMQFTIKQDSPLLNLKRFYCATRGVELDEVEFSYGGDSVYDNDTAGFLKMKEGAIINAVISD